MYKLIYINETVSVHSPQQLARGGGECNFCRASDFMNK
jgi:hypothetical protein